MTAQILSARARIDSLVAHTEALHAAMPKPHGRLTEGYGMAIRDVKAILAARPDDTTTEWGVRYAYAEKYELIVPYAGLDAAETIAAAHPGNHVVSRRVTPWQPVEK